MGIHESKTRLSEMVKALHEGRVQQYVIAVSGEPRALLTAYGPPSKRELGKDRGLISIHEDFDDPEFEQAFSDGSIFPK